MSWPLAKLDNHVDILSGFAFKSENFNDRGEGLPLVRIRDVVPGASDTYYSGEYSSDFLLSDGDLLIGMDGDFNRARWKGGQALLNQRVCKVTAKADSLDQGYLYHFLPKALEKIHAETPAVTVKHLSVKGIRSIEIPLPPLSEQKRIATILDKADAIRRKRQQAIQLADDFLRAVFLDMFGDPVTNPKGWKVKTLASITKDWRGGASIKPDDFTDSGFPVLHKGAIHQHGKIVLDESKKTFVSNEFAEAKKGSLVGRGCVAITLRDLVPSGPSIGLMADLSDYATDTYLLSQGAYGFCVKPEELHAAYLVALSNHDGFRQEFKKISVGSTQIHIRSSDLKELALPVPPVELQRKYGAIRRTVINFQKKAASGEEQGELFDSLSQKAFRGEL